jgi:Tol biopolymer transport system component
MSDRTGTMSIWALEMADGAPPGQPYLIKKNIGKMSPLDFTRDGGCMQMSFIRWSSDGKKFFSYGIEKKGCKGLYSIDTQTGAVDIILTCRLDEEVIKQLDVFPDGKTLAYKMWERKKVGEGNVMSIRVRDIRTGEEKELYHKVNASESHHMSLSSDGKRIAFSAAYREAELWVMENLLRLERSEKAFK